MHFCSRCCDPFPPGTSNQPSSSFLGCCQRGRDFSPLLALRAADASPLPRDRVMRSFPTSGEHLRDRTEKLLSGPHACTAEQELTLACPHERHRARRDSDLVTVQRGAGAPHELAAHPVMEKVLPAEQCPLTPCRGRVCPVTQSSISSRSEFYLFSREGLTQPSEACGLRHGAAPAGAAVGWTGKALEALRAALLALPPITEDCSNA